MIRCGKSGWLMCGDVQKNFGSGKRWIFILKAKFVV